VKSWNKRTSEIAYLLNPAFSASVIYSVICEYQKQGGKSFPFVLIYLILPIILHKTTRERINSGTNMIVWIQKFPDVLINFPLRARSMISFANEAIEYLLLHKIIILNGSNISISRTLSKASMQKTTDGEMLDCYKKSEHLGRWFARVGVEENIYAAWGVKP
jgi:hypothetical protein